MTGVRHLVQCHCVLPQFKKQDEPVFHKFIVFSTIDDSDTCMPKYVQCQNCGSVHKVVDICTTEIVPGKESLSSCTTIDDIELCLSEKVASILHRHKSDISLWENALFIEENERWGDTLILKKDYIDDQVSGKRLVFFGPSKVKIETFNETVAV